MKTMESDSAERLKKMISDVTEDIRLYQRELGSHIVHDPLSEAYRLCDVKLSLQRQLSQWPPGA